MASAIPPGAPWLVELLGEGRLRRRIVEAVAIIGVIGTVTGWPLAYYQAVRKPMIERVPVVFDSNFQFVGKMGGELDPAALDRLAVGHAVEWVKLYRSRPGSKESLRDNIFKLASMTDQKQWVRMGEKLDEHRKEFGNSVIRIDKITGNFESRLGAYQRKTRVYWTETIEAGRVETQTYSAMVTVAFRPFVETLDQFGTNIPGFYTMDANVSLEGR